MKEVRRNYFVRVIDDEGRERYGFVSKKELDELIKRNVDKIPFDYRFELTKDEVEAFHLTTLKLKYEDAIAEYKKCQNTPLGRLIANREIPVLKRARQIIVNINK